MGRTRRSFSQEFKVEAVRLVTEKNCSVAQVARDLGIRDTMLGRWKQELARSPTTAFPGQGHGLPDKEELRQLRRENERLRMERDILKKAAALFSKDSL
ncbi:MAG: transposase [Nitrospirales bacterium]|nr:MAG: transposase [Nitrospirales bacterium]